MLFSYEECSDTERRGYEDIFLSYLERLVRDLDKKVDRGRDRLRRSAEAKQQVHGMIEFIVYLCVCVCAL